MADKQEHKPIIKGTDRETTPSVKNEKLPPQAAIELDAPPIPTPESAAVRHINRVHPEGTDPSVPRKKLPTSANRTNAAKSIPTAQSQTVTLHQTPINRVHPGGLFSRGIRSKIDANTDTFTTVDSESNNSQATSNSTDPTNAAKSMLATQSETVGSSYTEKSPEHSSKPFNDRTTPPCS